NGIIYSPYSQYNLTMKCELSGLQVGSGEFGGKSEFVFSLPKTSRKLFRTKYIPGKEDDISFRFIEN
ncbi:MAG: hypothetical protein MJ158_02565, partial [Alphaproteobacteria bacterium]|nr:hypothetical protein [Alphaproteobacteria bacterium]